MLVLVNGTASLLDTALQAANQHSVHLCPPTDERSLPCRRIPAAPSSGPCLRKLRGAPDGLPDPDQRLFNGSPAVTISNFVIVLRHNFPADIVARALENADGAFQSTVLRLEAFFTSEGAQNFVVHHSSFCSSSQQFCSSSHGEAIDVKWGRRRLLWSLCDVRACCALMTRQARCCLFVDHGDVQQT